MKRLVFAALCVLLAAGMFSACDKKGGESAAPAANAAAAGGDGSLQKILDKKTFVLGLDDSFPPMGYRNEQNEIVGYDIDLAREVTRRMGVELVPQPIDWNAKEQELNTGEIDCIWNSFTILEERRKQVLFSPPYLNNVQVIVVKADSSVNSLAGLAGKTVGTQTGSSSIPAIDAAPEFKASLKGDIVEYPDFLRALMDLDVGGIDAVVIDVVVANYNIQTSGKPFRILSETLGNEELGIGFRLGDKALADKVWATLLEMAKDGTVAKITTDWFGSDISVIGK